MSKVQMAVQQIVDLGLWSKVCEYKGWNEWILNEGKINENEIVTFDSEFKKEETVYDIPIDKEIVFPLRGDDLKMIEAIKEQFDFDREDVLSWLCYLENTIKKQL